jgi:hypothetical protein
MEIGLNKASGICRKAWHIEVGPEGDKRCISAFSAIIFDTRFDRFMQLTLYTNSIVR